ncbi:MAG: 4-hydroxy-tetrahydrodipicolinate synthase [Clostridia bacterium]
MKRQGQEEFLGVYPAIVTPFTKEGKIDWAGLKDNVEFILDARVQGLVVGGTVGEFYTLTLDERKALLESVVRLVSGRAKVVAGTGAVTTEDTVQLTAHAREAGAGAALIVTPYYGLPCPDDIVAHYRHVADTVKMPIILYNIPGRTGVNLTPELVKRLSSIDEVVGLKDTSMNFIQMCETIRVAGEAITLLVGSDLFLFPGLAMGAGGAISPSANVIPSEVMRLFGAVRSKDYETAKAIQYRIYLLRSVFGLGTPPMGIKEIMNSMGLCGGHPRQPACELSVEQKHKVREVLRELGLL